MKILAAIGRDVARLIASTGRLEMFLAVSVCRRVRPPFYLRLIWRRVAGDTLHPPGTVHPPWAGAIVPLVTSSLLEDETS